VHSSAASDETISGAHDDTQYRADARVGRTLRDVATRSSVTQLAHAANVSRGSAGADLDLRSASSRSPKNTTLDFTTISCGS